MPHIGSYSSPLDRTQIFQVPLVPGYTTGRLYGQLQFNGTLQVPSETDNLVRGLVVNTGVNVGTIQINQCQNGTNPLAPRTQLTTAVVNPNGRTLISFTPTVPWVEVAALGTTGVYTTVSLQLTSRIEFNERGFARTDGLYPQILWAPQTYYGS